ncbi:MAG: hypothetical protein V3T77_03265, partial [Planctomycetota bacterium]
MQSGRILLTVGIFVAGGVLGFALRSAEEPLERTQLPSFEESEGSALPQVDAEEITRLGELVEAARKREAKLVARLKKLDAKRARKTKKPVAKLASFARSQRHSQVIDSVDEADAAAQEFIAKGDIEGLWLLGADLLNRGEEGFEKFLEVALALEQMEGDLERSFKYLWRDEEMLAGRFMRSFEENLEAVLRFELFLDGKNKQELPKLAQEFHDEMHQEMGVVMLGYYSGDDAKIFDGFVEMYRRHLAGDRVEDRRAKDRIRALGQIPNDASTLLL